MEAGTGSTASSRLLLLGYHLPEPLGEQGNEFGDRTGAGDAGILSARRSNAPAMGLAPGETRLAMKPADSERKIGILDPCEDPAEAPLPLLSMDSQSRSRGATERFVWWTKRTTSSTGMWI
jgi:hypothetical protein